MLVCIRSNGQLPLANCLRYFVPNFIDDPTLADSSSEEDSYATLQASSGLTFRREAS